MTSVSVRRRRWQDVLAQRAPPLRAAAKRRSQAELRCGAGPRREVYGALAGRLIAERRVEFSKMAERGRSLYVKGIGWDLALVT